MDPVTHLLSGVLLGQVWKKRIAVRGTVVFATVAAVAPDIDNFFGGDPEAYLRHHRELTHSVFGGLLLALVLAGSFCLLKRKKCSFGSALAMAYAAVLMHIFLDLATSYGTQIFFPLTDNRYTLESVFIIDPIFTLALVALLIVSIRRERWAKVGLALVFAYPLANFALKEAAEALLTRRLRSQGEQFSRLYVTTEAFSPLFWKVLLEDEQQYRIGELTLLQPLKEIAFERFEKLDRELARELSDQARFIKTWDWFALYPVVKREPLPDGEKLILRDLRFYSFNPMLRNRMRRMPFTVEALLGPNGKLKRLHYNGELIADAVLAS